jgi:hypothetical protein
VRPARSRTRGNRQYANPARRLDNAREACRILSRIAGGGDHKIVTGNLAFQVDIRGNPPDHRMQCEQSLYRSLDQQRIIIAPNKMSRFMDTNLFEVAFAQFP